MPSLEAWKIIVISGLIFIAGVVDSIAGGGGLISLSTYYAFGFPPVYVLGNNKFGSTFGTLSAIRVYVKNRNYELKSAMASASFALLGSVIGARISLYCSDYYFRHFLLFALVVIGFLTLKEKNLHVGKRKQGAALYLLSSIIGLFSGMYDGFFGPGTGMFLTLAFTSVLGLEPLEACGNVKIVNFSSNIAALCVYVAGGNIIYSLGICCALSSILGNYVGAKIATKGGGRVVRHFVFIVLILLFVNVLMSIVK